MQINPNADVFTIDGKDVGRITRVVIDPKTKEVTHLVLHKGILFTANKVVPVNLVSASRQERITLRMNADALNHLPNFQESHSIIHNEDALETTTEMPLTPNPATPAPPANNLTGFPAPQPIGEEPAVVEEIRLNIPAATIAFKEGASVITRDEQNAGSVVEILTDPQTKHMTHFVLAKGLVVREKKLIPVDWIESLAEDQVRLAVNLSQVNDLPAYEPA
jgi:uncharacterized protein YrrD